MPSPTYPLRIGVPWNRGMCVSMRGLLLSLPVLNRERRGAFTFPFSMAEQVVRGLEGTHVGGVRYPVPVYLRYQAEYPKSYQELERRWAEEKKRI